jgi:hypothetical protein
MRDFLAMTLDFFGLFSIWMFISSSLPGAKSVEESAVRPIGPLLTENQARRMKVSN